LIWGDPSQEINDLTLKAIQVKMKKSTPSDLPLIVIKPKLITYKKMGKHKIQRLPLIFYSLELESDSTDRKQSYSSLQYVGFSEPTELTNILKMIKKELKKFNWKKYAHNWNI
jgi:hypothetical protein